MANHFYNLKCIVPIKVQTVNPTSGLLEMKTLSKLERFNLLSRNQLICGTRPQDAFARFLNGTECTETLFDITTNPYAALDIPILNNIEYIVAVQSVKKLSFYTFRLQPLKEPFFNEIEDQEGLAFLDTLRESLADSPLDLLMKMRKNNETSLYSVNQYIADTPDNAKLQNHYVAFLLKYAKQQWIFEEGNHE